MARKNISLDFGDGWVITNGRAGSATWSISLSSGDAQIELTVEQAFALAHHLIVNAVEADYLNKNPDLYANKVGMP